MPGLSLYVVWRRWTLERLLPQDESNVTITEPHIVSRMFPIA